MGIEESVYQNLKVFGNTPLGMKTWKKKQEDILAYIHAMGMKVRVREVEEKESEYGLLTSFVVIEVKYARKTKQSTR